MAYNKRCLTYDEEDGDFIAEDDHSTGDDTTNVGELSMLGDVLLDILDELCQVRELLHQHMARGSRPSTLAPP